MKHAVKPDPGSHKVLRKRKKVARLFGSRFTKSTPSYRDNQNEEKGSFSASRDGYPEKQVTDESAKSAE